MAFWARSRAPLLTCAIIGLGGLFAGVTGPLLSAFVPAFVQDALGTHRAAIGGVMAIDNILLLVLVPLAGAASDRASTRGSGRLRIVIVGFVLAAIGMLLFPLFSRGMRPGAEVGPGEAVTLINRKDALVLDVRDEGEFNGGHVTHAKHVPEKQLEERMKELDKYKSKPIIVCCGAGRRRGAVADVLRKRGFAEVVSLRGGIGAWQQAGMPLEK